MSINPEVNRSCEDPRNPLRRNDSLTSPRPAKSSTKSNLSSLILGLCMIKSTSTSSISTAGHCHRTMSKITIVAKLKHMASPCRTKVPSNYMSWDLRQPSWRCKFNAPLNQMRLVCCWYTNCIHVRSSWAPKMLQRIYWHHIYLLWYFENTIDCRHLRTPSTLLDPLQICKVVPTHAMVPEVVIHDQAQRHVDQDRCMN